MPTGIEYYLPLFFEGLETLFDYLPKNTLFITENNIDEQIEQYWLDLNIDMNNVVTTLNALSCPLISYTWAAKKY